MNKYNQKVDKKSGKNHYWLCALTGLLAGFLAVFICTHNFEFFWPLNWPMKITSIPGPQPVTIYENISNNESSGEKDNSKFMNITVGDEITIDGCGWTYKGHINTKPISGAYIFCREFGDSGCGGKSWEELELRFRDNPTIVILHNQGIKRFMYVFDPL